MARQLGLNVVAVAIEHSTEGLIQAIVEHFSQRRE
jgi:hypothetical protein